MADGLVGHDGWPLRVGHDGWPLRVGHGMAAEGGA